MKKKYEYLLHKVASEIHSEKEAKIAEAIKARLKKKEQLEVDLKDLEKELGQLLTKGEITNLDTVIKINSGAKTLGSTTGICLSMDKY